MTSVEIKNTPSAYTPAPGSAPTEGAKKTEQTETGKGASGTAGTGGLPPAEGAKDKKSIPAGVGDGTDEVQFTDAELQTFYGIDDAAWAQITPRDKEIMAKAMIQMASQAVKQQTDGIVLNAATAMTANIAQAGELDKAASKVLTQGILSLVAGAGLGVLGAGMQGVSAFKLAKSSAGETLKTFNANLKEMNTKATEAGKKMTAEIKEMSGEMTKLSEKASNGTLTKLDIDNFKAKYGATLEKVIGADSYKAFTDKLDKTVANGLNLAAQDVAKEAFQDVQRQTTSGTSKAVKQAKADARNDFIQNNEGMKQATAAMEYLTAPLRKYEAIGAIAGAGEKSVNAGGTIAGSEAKSAEADASREQANAAQATASRDVVSSQKQAIDAFIQKLIDFLDRIGQTEVDQMGAVTRGK